MGLIGQLMNAGIAGIQAGYVTARRVFEDPATAYQQEAFYNQATQYQLLWSYYNNAMFDRTIQVMNRYQNYALNPWAGYKSNYNLYRNIRMIYNPTRRLVDFYAGQIYPGMLSEDGKSLPDGVPLAIPFSEDTPRALKDAIAQFWQWSNWQAKKSLQVRFGGALGSVLIEIVDDVEHGKVTADIIWPGFVYDLVLDGAGNVKSYAIQYPTKDERGSYLYRKEVDQQQIRYFRDGDPYDFGNGAVLEHPYGFVPTVWIRPLDMGGDHGSPLISGSIGKIDELNNLASHVHDQIHKKIGAPMIVWSSDAIGNLFTTKKRGITNEFDTPQAGEEENILMWKGSADGHVDSLTGELNLSEAAGYMTQLLLEIEQDHPELTFYKELRSMSQVTGPAAARLSGDVAARVSESMAVYDQATMSLFRMAVAIAGFRANAGAWGRTLTPQQQKFLPFDLDSYASGKLDMAIMPRPLLVPTKLEVANQKVALWQGVSLAVSAGVPLEFVLKDEGWTDQELAELKTMLDAQKKEAQAQQDKTLQIAQAKQIAPPQQQQGQNQPSQHQQLPLETQQP